MRLKRVPGQSPEIDVVPMVDCVFQLIVFFLVATQLKRYDPAPVELPLAAHPAKADTESPLVVTVLRPDRDGGMPYVAQGRAVDAAGLRSMLRDYTEYSRRSGQDAPIVRLRADRNAILRQVQQCLLACREAGIHQVRIAAVMRSIGQEGTP